MKYLLAAIGMAIGQAIGWLIADSRVIDWTIGLILGTAGYLLPSFLRYIQSSPKKLLSFHGPDSPISKSTSSGELRTFLSQLREGGLLLDFNPNNAYATVDRFQWADLTEPEKLTLFQVLAQAKAVDGKAAPDIRLVSGDGKLLAKYSIADGIIALC